MASAAVVDPIRGCQITAPEVQRTNQSNASEVEQVKCECCGLTEECTRAYIWQVRGVHCGKWVCGLCAEAVKEEMGRGNIEGSIEDALKTHMGVCMQFNGIERTANPVTDIALAMKRLLRRSITVGQSPRSAPSSPRRGGVIARTNSCMTPFARGRGYEGPL